MPQDWDLEQVRKEWIGKETDKTPGRYPVEYDPIRRHCHMVGDTNPLFLDADYAKAQGYRDAVCPPTLVSYFAGQGIWPPSAEGPGMLRPLTPGNRFINMSNEVEYLKPVCVGDRLSVRSRVADVFVKGIRIDPEAVWTVTERIVSNQMGEDVVIERNTLLTHRSPEDVAAAAKVTA